MRDALSRPDVSSVTGELPRGVDVPLVCPSCRGSLVFRAVPPEGAWHCQACQASYPVVKGVARFVPNDGYADSFSFEWLRHRTTQLDGDGADESERTFRQKTGFTPQAIRGKRVLDAGCGMGRFADVVSRWGGQVVALDLSEATTAARENLGGRDHVFVCQANLLEPLPFAEGTFDYIYSLGVLHHTPDCERAFRGLVRYLAPGGTIAIWVYADDGGLWMKCTDAYRRLTTRLPRRLLYRLCYAAVPGYYVYRIPLVGRLLRTLLPMSEHPRADWRILDTFDWYSPRYQSKHTYPEVYRWFRTEGLDAIRLLPFPVALSGVKPQEPRSRGNMAGAP